jgi:hypothetical protein
MNPDEAYTQADPLAHKLSMKELLAHKLSSSNGQTW